MLATEEGDTIALHIEQGLRPAKLAVWNKLIPSLVQRGRKLTDSRNQQKLNKDTITEFGGDALSQQSALRTKSIGKH
ncbi:unnamed protein product [Protopolystoma xenopodis]|uniref:Uncharacterized protein n=1 Tax=Protopolystoma xenopodis TaxID=117903 RepID=A0A448WKZ0_9PLAT|nr:unnamed protein product [Protopolystoma xenopodis]